MPPPPYVLHLGKLIRKAGGLLLWPSEKFRPHKPGLKAGTLSVASHPKNNKSQTSQFIFGPAWGLPCSPQKDMNNKPFRTLLMCVWLLVLTSEPNLGLGGPSEGCPQHK